MSVSPLSLKVQNKAKEELSGSDIFAGKKVLLYFSAHWCPPCRNFTPVLKDFYASAKEAEKPIECVFVSSDKAEEDMWSYFNEAHGNYYVLPFNAPERQSLPKQYKVSGIPCLVVVDENGKVIKDNARADVENYAKNSGSFDFWEGSS